MISNVISPSKSLSIEENESDAEEDGDHAANGNIQETRASNEVLSILKALYCSEGMHPPDKELSSGIVVTNKHVASVSGRDVVWRSTHESTGNRVSSIVALREATEPTFGQIEYFFSHCGGIYKEVCCCK